eukprot:scaffold1440_cov332-Pavlova_lutheri.AAC.35
MPLHDRKHTFDEAEPWEIRRHQQNRPPFLHSDLVRDFRTTKLRAVEESNRTLVQFPTIQKQTKRLRLVRTFFSFVSEDVVVWCDLVVATGRFLRLDRVFPKGA